MLFKYVLPFVLIASLLGYGGYKVHENGRQVERVAWQEQALKEAEATEAALTRAYEMRMLQAAEHLKQIEELTNVKKKAIDVLERDVAALSARGLYIPASACPDPGGGEATNTGGVSSTASRIRLPKKVEDDLIDLAADAQRVVIQYEGCRTELKDLTITGAAGAPKPGRRPP